ncbi:hypothetical protein [Mycolicibacterium mengxianglii]|uniref:hypothetical protein n=1 Tax=Mycolicibacterium mengxianglii TaxID=2736649 RepID=UPI001E50E813|nr:hypothetical protein [Mycolicibacterium mengxianglii]
MTSRSIGQVLAGAALVAACVVGCSDTVGGTPVAAPGQAPGSTPETTRTSPSPSTSARPGQPTRTPPTRTSTPNATGSPAADTTCDEYIDLDEDGQREVITAIGGENDLVALNPDLWITITSALCTFAEPSTPVRDVLEGQGIR